MEIVLLLLAVVVIAVITVKIWRMIRIYRLRKQALESAFHLSNSLSKFMCDVSEIIRPGVSTADIDKFLGERAVSAGLMPYFQGYGDYPFATTTSINDEVINTLPSNRVLCSGDLFKLQFGLSDGIGYVCQAWTYPVGVVSQSRQRLLENTSHTLSDSIKHIKAGKKVGDIGSAIAASLSKFGLHGSKDFVGYRMSFVPRECPRIACDGPGPDAKSKLKQDMVLQFIVIAHAGKPDVYIDKDMWNVKTEDGSDSVLFSHMLIVKADRAKCLTKPLVRSAPHSA